MKKRTVKNLMLNKRAISSFQKETIKGMGGGTGGCHSGNCTRNYECITTIDDRCPI